MGVSVTSPSSSSVATVTSAVTTISEPRPVPVRSKLKGFSLRSFETRIISAWKFPMDVGANVTSNVELAPGASWLLNKESSSVNPSAAVSDNPVRSSVWLPELLTVKVRVTVEPIAMSAKTYVRCDGAPSGVSVMSPSWSPPTAVVSSESSISEPVLTVTRSKLNGASLKSLLSSVNVARKSPASTDRNVTSKDVLLPAASDVEVDVRSSE